MEHSVDSPQAPILDAIIIGAGFAGLYMLYKLRQLGFKALVLEAGSDVGGTWYWNRYPGCRCDVESLEYSYSFSDELQQSWQWSERYAPQEEILEYARHVADRFDLRTDICFETRVKRAVFDESTNAWTAEAGDGRSWLARTCIMATGCLSAGRIPDFPGLSDFAGAVYQTSAWPFEGVDFSGQRVAVVGVGSSGVQAIPLIAEQAKHLYVLQRTPNYVVPARNAALPVEVEQQAKASYKELRDLALTMPGGVILRRRPQSALEVSPEELRQGFEERWEMGGAFNFMSSFGDVQSNPEANRLASEFARSKIAEIVRDPQVAMDLMPPHLMGTRRLCVGTNYYETFNRSNVTLVNLRKEPVTRFTATGVIVGEGQVEIDVLVLATGFDAITGALTAMEIVGRGGETLRDHWAAGAKTQLGLMSRGFPNLFMITGPGSPSVLSNVLVSIEQHVNWIGDCLQWLRNHNRALIEATHEGEAAWMDEVAQLGSASLLAGGDSWYLGANVPGKPRLFMPYCGGVPAYRERCAKVAHEGYSGFRLS